MSTKSLTPTLAKFCIQVFIRARKTERTGGLCIVSQWLLSPAGKLTYSAVRVYMHIAARADWRGVLATTRAAIAREIGISAPSVSEGINELKRYDLIRESKERGVPTFVINPAYATLGRNKNARLKTFNELPNAREYVELDIGDFVF